jgi:ABC-type xylose transport system substrate-binding protein
LNAKGIKGIPVSGQDGDHAALNRVALGSQTVSVWKDARDLGRDAAAAAVTLAKGQKVAGAQTEDQTFLLTLDEKREKDNLAAVELKRIVKLIEELT